jgi:hypothetical protein
MNLREVIRRRIRHKAEGVDVQADINAVVAANVGERGASTATSSRQTVTHRSARTASAESRTDEKRPDNDQSG